MMTFSKQYLHGLSSAVRGFQYLCRYPSLWQYGIAPVLINIVVALAVWLLSFQLCRAFWNHYSALPSDAWWQGPLNIVLMVTFVLVAVGLALGAYVTLQSVFCAWFFSLLARRVEQHLGVSDTELRDISLLCQIYDALRAVFKLLVLNLVILLLHLIPIVGSMAAIVIGLYLDAFILGSEFLGYPLELRGDRWLTRQSFAKQHLGATTGLGSIVTLLMLIPIVGAVFQTTAVVGAVLLRRKLLGQPTRPPGDRDTDEME